LPHVLIERKKGGSQAAAQINEKISLEHDPEKWTPVFGKDHTPNKISRSDRYFKPHFALA
jgi:hypothetical protein